MADLEPRRGSGLTRRQREQRAFQLAVVGGIAGAVAVVGFVLAVLDVVGGGIPVIALIIAIVCLVMFRRTVGLGR
jgi:putative flippase GtrA